MPLGGSFTVETPNYPNDYDADEYCWFEINGEFTQNLRIEVEDFATGELYKENRKERKKLVKSKAFSKKKKKEIQSKSGGFG